MEDYSKNPQLVNRIAKAMYQEAYSTLPKKWSHVVWEGCGRYTQKIWKDRAKAALDEFRDYEVERYHNG